MDSCSDCLTADSSGQTEAAKDAASAAPSPHPYTTTTNNEPLAQPTLGVGSNLFNDMILDKL